MKCLVTSARPYDRAFLEKANDNRHELFFVESRLDRSTVSLARGFPAVCPFVDDRLDAECVRVLFEGGTRILALRSTGYNNVDLDAARSSGMTVMRVREYSPFAVAEFALGLMLVLNRHIHRAYNRVREGNFLLDGFLGFDMHGRTAGIVGTGKIGTALARILSGMGCRILGFDARPSPACLSLGMEYRPLGSLLAESDIVSLHLPLQPETRHIIDREALDRMKPTAMLVNTSRGGLIDSAALVDALKARKIGAVGLDVYEEEAGLYFRDHGEENIDDDVFARLLTFSNVVVTGHQAYFTRDAMEEIARTTLSNLDDFEASRKNDNTVCP
uniref:2-hydroxyacid dehydrogenase n=1 Tax=Leptospirillum ferriphilum TaxID=178606 RepID=A0A7C3R0V4_9BACT